MSYCPECEGTYSGHELCHDCGVSVPRKKYEQWQAALKLAEEALVLFQEMDEDVEDGPLLKGRWAKLEAKAQAALTAIKKLKKE